MCSISLIWLIDMRPNVSKSYNQMLHEVAFRCFNHHIMFLGYVNNSCCFSWVFFPPEISPTTSKALQPLPAIIWFDVCRTRLCWVDFPNPFSIISMACPMWFPITLTSIPEARLITAKRWSASQKMCLQTSRQSLQHITPADLSCSSWVIRKVLSYDKPHPHPCLGLR